MVFWIVFLLLVILFLLSTSVHITKTIKWASLFSPKTSHYVQLFIILVLCVITSMQFYIKLQEGMTTNATNKDSTEVDSNMFATNYSSSPEGTGSSTTPAPYTYESTVNLLNSANASELSNMTKQELTEYLNRLYDYGDSGREYVNAPSGASGQISIDPIYNEIQENADSNTAPAPSDDSESSTNANTESSYDKFGSPVYNKANALIYKGGSYIPSYSDFMLANNIPMHPKEINDKIVKNVGFCEYYQALPEEIENQCNNSDLNACASINCCTLLKGEKGVKCVAGNEYGPTNKNNYNNPMIGTLNEYYHKGKCYGNCPPG